MGDHALSQEEIDALLRGDTLPDDAELMDLEPIVKLFQVVLDHMAGVVSPVAGQTFEPGRVVAETMSWEDVHGRLITPLAARVDYSGDLEGMQVSVADGSTQQQLRALSEEEPTTILNKMALAFAAGLEEQLGLTLETKISSFAPLAKEGQQLVPWRGKQSCAVFDLSLHSSGGDVAWQEVLPADFARELLDRLAGQTFTPPPAAAMPAAPPAPAAPSTAPAPPSVPGGGAVAAAPTPPAAEFGSPVEVAPAHFAPLAGAAGAEQGANIGLIMDVPLQVTVELGRRRMLVRDVLELGKGSLIELEKLAGEPVDVFVNGKLIAKGEVVVIDENFGVKVTSIVTPVERLQNLQ